MIGKHEVHQRLGEDPRPAQQLARFHGLPMQKQAARGQCARIVLWVRIPVGRPFNTNLDLGRGGGVVRGGVHGFVSLRWYPMQRPSSIFLAHGSGACGMCPIRK